MDQRRATPKTIQTPSSLIHGKHTFRFGGVFSNGAVDYLRAGEGRGRVDFDSLTDFLSGNVRDLGLLSASRRATSA